MEAVIRVLLVPRYYGTMQYRIRNVLVLCGAAPCVESSLIVYLEYNIAYFTVPGCWIAQDTCAVLQLWYHTVVPIATHVKTVSLSATGTYMRARPTG